ncbi:tetratricopeptide repeat-containing diguanylate cyclase [Litorilituus sediminis]|uniref:diguanylate cyclase n=1 Tax=Litorilituus sediminis TaxID=718192 RepID=A0A4P6P2Y3_9GAMM|nr:GGDEF domain-containing protein [Litorilituus sediminis]QBG34259.1 GGDEF domain-containing protein [Litorilituus sediminis]
MQLIYNIKAFWLLLILFSFALQVVASNEINLNTLSTDELLQLADEKRSSDYILASKIIDRLDKIPSSLSDNQSAYLAYLKAYRHSFQSEYDQAISLLNSLQNNNSDISIKYRSIGMLINLYANRQDWHNGILQITKLISLTPQIKNKELVQASNISVAIFYNQLAQYQHALDYLDKIKSIIDGNLRDKCIISQQRLLAKLRLLLNEYEVIKSDANLLHQDIKKGLSVCQTAEAKLFINILHTYQAELYLTDKQPEKVITALLPRLNDIKSVQYPILVTLTYNLLAQAYWQLGDTTNTEKYAHLALENDVTSTDSFQTVTTKHLLYQLAEHKGDYKKAFELHKEYSLAKQKVNDEEQAKELAFQLASQKDFANKTEIKTLTRANDILTNEQSLSEQQQENSLLLLVLLLTVVGLGVTWGYKTWLSQQKLKQLTECDDLTQVHSRRHFIALAQQTINQCQVEKKPLTCLVFDLDRFKKINDNFGHHTGDAVLKEVANTCKQVCRPTDILGRLGGEEFAIILPNCELLMGEDLANKCREKIAQINYDNLGLIEPITASFGITCVDVSGFELNKLLADADDAMYSAKQHGRNCVQSYK